ncbi:MAG: slr1659 superfamily regulator [Gammaproteobacteria bacterium]
MDISEIDYQVRYDPEAATITCSGSFRLTGDGYAAITEILNAAADSQPPELILDLTRLKFLNSSGINTLCRFAIYLRKCETTRVTVKGNSNFPWQRKSLTNLQRLLPNIRLEFG